MATAIRIARGKDKVRALNAEPSAGEPFCAGAEELDPNCSEEIKC